MIYRRVKERKLNRIEFLMMVFFAAYYILPSFSLKISFVVVLFIAGMYALYLCTRDSNFGMIILKYLFIIAFIALLYTLFTEATSISQMASNRMLKRFASKAYQLLMMYFPAMLLWRIHQQGNEEQKKKLLFFSLAFVGYVAILTLEEIAINPNVTKTWSNFAEHGMGNVGGYYFVYCIPVIIPLLLMLHQRAKAKWMKILLLSVVIVLFMFLLRSQYTLALLMAIVAVAIVVFKGILDVRSKAVFFFSIVATLLFLPHVLYWLSIVVPSEQISDRLYEMYALLWYGDATGYNLMGRLNLYWKAILAFIKSPIWGNRWVNFDGHATFLMVLADLGLLGGIPFYYLFFSMRKVVGSILGKWSSEFTPIFLTLTIMGFTNPINVALPTNYTVWFVAPLLIEVLNSRKDVGNNAELGC